MKLKKQQHLKSRYYDMDQVIVAVLEKAKRFRGARQII